MTFKAFRSNDMSLTGFNVHSSLNTSPRRVKEGKEHGGDVNFWGFHIEQLSMRCLSITQYSKQRYKSTQSSMESRQIHSTGKTHKFKHTRMNGKIIFTVAALAHVTSARRLNSVNSKSDDMFDGSNRSRRCLHQFVPIRNKLKQ